MILPDVVSLTELQRRKESVRDWQLQQPDRQPWPHGQAAMHQHRTRRDIYLYTSCPFLNSCMYTNGIEFVNVNITRVLGQWLYDCPGKECKSSNIRARHVPSIGHPYPLAILFLPSRSKGAGRDGLELTNYGTFRVEKTNNVL